MDLPSEDSLRWIVSRYAGLHARHGAGIGAPELVQPTGDYFPDAFTPTGEAVAQLLARTLEYVPVKDGLDVRLRFVDASGEEEGGACGTGGCGSKAGSCGTGAKATDAPRDRVLELEDGYLLEMPAESVGHPVALTTALSRAAGAIVLAEADEDVSPVEVGGMSELAAIASGLGVLIVSGAHVYGKSCGGARISRHTHLTVEEASVALALFVALHGKKPSVARAHLETTQREAFAEALDWVESNPLLLAQLRTRPEVLEAGLFRIEEPKGFLATLFARRKASEEEAAFSAASPKRSAS